MEFRSLFGQQPSETIRNLTCGVIRAQAQTSARWPDRNQPRELLSAESVLTLCRLAMLAEGWPTHCSELALAKHREASSAKLAGLHLRASGFSTSDSAEFRQRHVPCLHVLLVFQWRVRRSEPAKTHAAVQSALKVVRKQQGGWVASTY